MYNVVLIHSVTLDKSLNISVLLSIKSEANIVLLNVSIVPVTSWNVLHGSHWESWAGIMSQVQCQITQLGKSKVLMSDKLMVALCQGQESTDSVPEITIVF